MPQEFAKKKKEEPEFTFRPLDIVPKKTEGGMEFREVKIDVKKPAEKTPEKKESNEGEFTFREVNIGKKKKREEPAKKEEFTFRPVKIE